MSTTPDTGPRKRSTLSAAKLIGRLSVTGLQSLYIFGRLLQYPLEASFWILSGFLAGLDTEIMRRKESFK